MRRTSAAVAVATLTAALTAVLGAGMGAGMAHASPASSPLTGSTSTGSTSTAKGGSRVRTTGLAVDEPRHSPSLTTTSASTPAAGAAPQLVSGTQTTQSVTEMTTFCPSGQKFGREYGNESFENGLPIPESSVGWTQATGGPAADGAAWAKSVVLTTEQDPDHFLYGLDAPIPTSGKVYAYFAYRTNATGDNAIVVVGDEAFSLQPAANWTYVLLDVSSQIGFDPGHMYVDFDQRGVGIAGDETFEVDDVGAYSCVPIPNSGVRGDWTGEGTVDLLATTNGNLYVFPGLGNGTFGSSKLVGSGWGGFTWLASPGDVNGDRRTDLVARNAAGDLVLYAGRGDGGFYSGRVIGTGWNIMTALATPGDMNLDGRPELLARRTDGTLHLYTFSSTGAISRVKQIGAGWNTTRLIIGRGDLNGDRRGDLLGVRTDGTLWAYLTSSTLTFGKATLVGSGWGAMDLVSSPGDVNKDGYGDLVARRASDGSLFFYPGRAGGTFGHSQLVGPGWASMTNIL
jgi:hypothetical protein